MGYLSDFSNFDEGLVDVKLHEETILKNEIQDDTNFSKFEPIVLSLYPDKKINSKVINFETDELILLDGHHRWKYANKTDSVNKLKCILVNFDDIKIKSYFLSDTFCIISVSDENPLIKLTESFSFLYL